jgi:hypothetical protein
MFERTSRDSARPVVTLARTRSVRRLPTVSGRPSTVIGAQMLVSELETITNDDGSAWFYGVVHLRFHAEQRR